CSSLEHCLLSCAGGPARRSGAGDFDRHRGGPPAEPAGAGRAARDRAGARKPVSPAPVAQGLRQDHRVPRQASRAQAPELPAHAQGADREKPAGLPAHALLAQPLPSHAGDAARLAGAAGRPGHEARRALRPRRGGRARLSHAEGVRPRARWCLRARGGRRVPRLPRTGRGRAAPRGSRRRHRGDLRAARGRCGGAGAPRRPGRQVPDAAPAGPERRPRVSRFRDVARFTRLLRRYVAPHWPALALLLLTSALATVLAALLPVVMAPILDLALGGARTAPAAGVGGLTLSNLGAADTGWLGVAAADDRFRAIVLLCLAYVAVGVVKGWLDFGNYLLALWLRVRAASALQADLFRHLLTMSMSFFTRHR